VVGAYHLHKPSVSKENNWLFDMLLFSVCFASLTENKRKHYQHVKFSGTNWPAWSCSICCEQGNEHFNGTSVHFLKCTDLFKNKLKKKEIPNKILMRNMSGFFLLQVVTNLTYGSFHKW